MTDASASRRPIIGITADANAEKQLVGRAYIDMVVRAGGVPVVLPSRIECVDDYLRLCDGLVLTGGDDPITTDPRLGGVPMHPKAKPVDPERQAFELALLDALERLACGDQRSEAGDHGSAKRLQPAGTSRQPLCKPVLGICLGMQLMGLHAGGELDQHLPDTLPTAALHWDKHEHEVAGELGEGVVHSHHRQALRDAGRLRVVATAPDGVIEAVCCNARRFYLGVQWHPERTADELLGVGLFRQLVAAAARAQ